MDASELSDYFARQNASERWQVMFERDAARLISPHGPEGDITVPYEIADAAGLQHANAKVAAQLATMFERASRGHSGGHGGRY